MAHERTQSVFDEKNRRRPLERARAGTLAAALLLSTTPLHAEHETRFRFVEPLKTPGDVYLWPVNLHLGYANTRDANHSESGFAFGMDVATFTYDALVVDTATLRAAIRGVSGDFFVGTRVLGAVYPGHDLTHQLALGTGLGWGSIGTDFDAQRDGHFIVAPAVRYMIFGLAGLELAAHFPVARGGDAYPTLITVNVMGLGLLVAAAGM
ncbi:MAG: hypothetical protein R3B13_17180 [Polyangiaceae bacterium]